MEEVLNFLKECGTFFIATVDGDQARVRPFGAVTEFEGKLFLITGKEKSVFKQIAANPKVEISAANAKGEWLRVTAKAVNDDRKEIKEKMLEEVPMLKSMYSADDGNMAMLYLAHATAVFASYTSAPRTVTF